MAHTPEAGAARPTAAAPNEINDIEREVLDFEARTWPRGGAKLAAIRETFGWSETRYYQVLRALLDRSAALQHAPQLVHRLRTQVAAHR